MAHSASLGELITKMSVSYFVISAFSLGPIGCRDSSRHVGASHRPTQPSDNKIVFLNIIFRLEANNKTEGGARGFSLSLRQGLSGKHNCFVAPSLKAIFVTARPSGSAIRQKFKDSFPFSRTRLPRPSTPFYRN
jgi:hypothetical protein